MRNQLALLLTVLSMSSARAAEVVVEDIFDPYTGEVLVQSTEDTMRTKSAELLPALVQLVPFPALLRNCPVEVMMKGVPSSVTVRVWLRFASCLIDIPCRRSWSCCASWSA